MPEWWQDLDGWAGVIVAAAGLLTAFGTILAARWAYLSKQHAKEAAVDARDARDEVKNSHGTNLRDDLDGASALAKRSAIAAERAADAAEEASAGVGELRGLLEERMREIRRDLTQAQAGLDEDIKDLRIRIGRVESRARQGRGKGGAP